MGASSYPGMTQPFTMTHGSNMGSVGVRQDSMGKSCQGVNITTFSIFIYISICLRVYNLCNLAESNCSE